MVSNTGGVLTLSPSFSATVTASSWYKGDTLTLQQPIDTDQTVTTGIYASDPAFEKAMRAMALIAQGAYGTPGGLANNQGRLSAATYLLQDSLQSPAPGTPPYGTEETSDISTLASTIGFTQSTIANKTTNEQTYAGFIQNRLAKIEQSDPTTTITELLADNNALQASYQSLSKMWSLSLLDYIK